MVSIELIVYVLAIAARFGSTTILKSWQRQSASANFIFGAKQHRMQTGRKFGSSPVSAGLGKGRALEARDSMTVGCPDQ
jgi:hypothetical protein